MPSPILGEGPDLPYGYLEFKESPEEEVLDFQAGEANFTRIFDGPWVDRFNFINEHILPSVFEADGTLIFSAGAAYPDYPAAYAYKASITGKAKTDKNDEGMITHGFARIKVFYRTRNFVPGDEGGGGGGGDPNRPDPLYVIESLETEVELIPLVARGFTYYYKSNGQFVDPNHPDIGNPSIISKKATEKGKINYTIVRWIYNLKLPYMINPRWAAIDFCTGKLNWNPFITPSGLFAPKGTIRFDGLTGVTKRELSFNYLVWELDFKFTYYRPGWNTIPVAEAANFIVHAPIIPQLYFYTLMESMFVDVDIGQLLDVNRNFDALPEEQKRKIQGNHPDDLIGLKQQEVTAIANQIGAVNMWK